MKKLLVLLSAIVLCFAMMFQACGVVEEPQDSSSVNGGNSASGSEDSTPAEDEKVTGPEDKLVDGLDSTIGFWRLNEGKGVVAVDEKNGYNATMTNKNESSWVATDNGTGVAFEGQNNQYLAVPTTDAFAPLNLTVEFIFKMPTSAKYRTDHRLIFKDQQFDIHLFNPAGGSPSLFFMLRTQNDDAWSDRIGINGAVYDNQFHHVAMTYNGITGKMDAYFDYVLEGSTQLKGGRVIDMDRDLMFGGGYWQGAPQQCSTSVIDSVRLSNEVLHVSDFLGSTAEKGEIDNGTIGKQRVLEYDFTKTANKDLSGRFDAVATDVGEDKYTENGLTLDGTGYLSVDNNAIFSGLTSYSFETLVKLDPQDRIGGSDYILAFRDNTFMINVWCVDNNTSKLVVKGGADFSDRVIDVDLFDNNVHHIGLTYDDDTKTFKAYVDYVEKVSHTAANAVVANENKMYIGAGYWGEAIQRKMKGTVLGVKLVNHAVQNISFIGYKPNDMIVGHWTFDGNLNDSSANGLNGVAVGDATPVDGKIKFDGSNAVKVPSDPKMMFSSITMEAVVNFAPEDMHGDHGIFFKDLSFFMKIWVEEGVGAHLITQFQTTEKGWAKDSTWTLVNEIFDGKDHHLAVSYDSVTGLIRVYVDHNLKDEVQLVAGSEQKGSIVVFPEHPIYIGAGYWADAPQQGTRGNILEARLANYVVAVEDMLTVA